MVSISCPLSSQSSVSSLPLLPPSHTVSSLFLSPSPLPSLLLSLPLLYSPLITTAALPWSPCPPPYTWPLILSVTHGPFLWGVRSRNSNLSYLPHPPEPGPCAAPQPPLRNSVIQETRERSSRKLNKCSAVV